MSIGYQQIPIIIYINTLGLIELKRIIFVWKIRQNLFQPKIRRIYQDAVVVGIRDIQPAGFLRQNHALCMPGPQPVRVYQIESGLKRVRIGNAHVVSLFIVGVACVLAYPRIGESRKARHQAQRQQHKQRTAAFPILHNHTSILHARRGHRLYNIGLGNDEHG